MNYLQISKEICEQTQLLEIEQISLLPKLCIDVFYYWLNLIRNEVGVNYFIICNWVFSNSVWWNINFLFDFFRVLVWNSFINQHICTCWVLSQNCLFFSSFRLKMNFLKPSKCSTLKIFDIKRLHNRIIKLKPLFILTFSILNKWIVMTLVCITCMNNDSFERINVALFIEILLEVIINLLLIFWKRI